MKQKILIAVLAALLAACGNPTANSAGTDQSNQSSIDSTFAWTKKLVRGWTAKATLTIPAQGAIADALLDQKFLGGRLDGGLLREVAPMTVKMGGFKTVFVEKFGPTAKNAAADAEDTWLAPVAAVTHAYRGWQIDLIGGFGDKEATPKEKEFYLGYQEASVEYTNALFTQIATRLNDDVGVLEDPETAKIEIQRIYKSIPKSVLKKLWVNSVEHAAERGGRTVDLSGSQGVDWSADGGSYSGNADGLTWTKAGVAWFGQGALSGKQWSIGLESSISKSTDKSSGGSESVKSGTSEKSSAGAQPK